jgi:hypothetical protein
MGVWLSQPRTNSGPAQRADARQVHRLDHLRQPLQMHLVDDPRARRDDAQGLECLLGPFEEAVALGVAAVLVGDVALDRVGMPRHIHDQE